MLVGDWWRVTKRQQRAVLSRGVTRAAHGACCDINLYVSEMVSCCCGVVAELCGVFVVSVRVCGCVCVYVFFWGLTSAPRTGWAKRKHG